MHIDGSCHCGDIAYEAEIDPGKVIICHCTDCQVLSSSAFRMIVVAEKGSFRLRSGQPAVYVKTADSGRKRAQAFCPRCGTQLYSTPGDENPPQHYGLRVGSIRQRAALKPARQFWTRSAFGWVEDVGAIPHSEDATPTPRSR